MSRISTEEYIANLSIDCVIFGYEDAELKVLLGKLPFGIELYNLPGGHIRKSESVDAAAVRLLFERTQLQDVFLTQFKVFGDENRIVNSPFRELMIPFLQQKYEQLDVEWIMSRFVCIGFYAIVDISKVQVVRSEFDERLEWKSIHEIPEMIYDHQEIFENALFALRQNFDRFLNANNLLPETFTMKELQQVYETVFEKEFPMNNFQKKILELNVLDRLEKKYTGSQHKAPYLYKFK